MNPTTELQKNYRTNTMETINMNRGAKEISLHKIADRMILSWWILYLSSIFAITFGLVIMN